ncbi:hypothetical protein BS47DRAFT_1368958 [Hydnum rufescens UP504]|uniref:Uncharacterized protein n=1 Tax=Hydnum rufescens UP504 TaxID=1448309 RepID=A0A9P6DN35_9AGAM|nr:hypothetical protein BS47DRAFT_1368958 [Hydnum rufescens UP504]
MMGRIWYHTPAAAGPSLHETHLTRTWVRPRMNFRCMQPLKTRSEPALNCTTHPLEQAPLCQNPPNESMDSAPHVVPMCTAAKNPEGPALCDITTPAGAGVVIPDYLYQHRNQSNKGMKVTPTVIQICTAAKHCI